MLHRLPRQSILTAYGVLTTMVKKLRLNYSAQYYRTCRLTGSSVATRPISRAHHRASSPPANKPPLFHVITAPPNPPAILAPSPTLPHTPLASRSSFHHVMSRISLFCGGGLWAIAPPTTPSLQIRHHYCALLARRHSRGTNDPPGQCPSTGRATRTRT